MAISDATTSKSTEQVRGSDPAVLSRSGLLGRVGQLSMGSKLSLASAAVFAGLASRNVPSADAANWLCYDLAFPNHWCAAGSGGLPFNCPSSGGPWYKRAWYCCGPGGMVGC